MKSSSAHAAGFYFEAILLAQTILGNGLRSLLRNSGGEGKYGHGKPISTLGRKLEELSKRANKDAVLKANFEHDRLDAWRQERTNLLRAMAEASLTVQEIDAKAKTLADDGMELVRRYSMACRLLRAQRKEAKLPLSIRGSRQ
jgi:hypothetical protein